MRWLGYRKRLLIVIRLALIVLLWLRIAAASAFLSTRTSNIIICRRSTSCTPGGSVTTISRRMVESNTPSTTTTTTTTTGDSNENNKPAPFRLGYVTDVEGNLDYFKSYVAKSNVLDLVVNDDDDDDGHLHLELRDNDEEISYFVYGGDVVDKGSGDIRLCRALVSLRQRYPDRVFLLVGNRDLNKLRFTAELSSHDMDRQIDEIPPPHWDPKAPTLRQYLESIVKDGQTIDDINTRVNRLHYLLKETLGCPKTFEYRRQELYELRRHASSDETTTSSVVTDEQVVDSFIYEVEEGCLWEYMNHAQVAAVVGNTLFVHGCLDANTMKFVPSLQSKFENPPSRPLPGRVCDNLHDWVDEMNAYLKAGLEDYKQRPLWDTNRETRGGEALMALQNRPAMWGRSIVSNCYSDGGCITTDHAAEIRNDRDRIKQESHNPLIFEGLASDPLDERVALWCLQHGIRRVVVGHKPSGDCAAVLSASHTGVEIVSADTSFSDTSAEDNRGRAVAVVEIVGRNPLDNQLELSGTFKCGQEYHCQFPSLNTEEDSGSNGDPILGRQVEDQWWIKASNATHYQFCRGKGRNVSYKMVPIEDIGSIVSQSIT